jgi:hypothetical protein
MGNEVSILDTVSGWEFDRALRASNYMTRMPGAIRAHLPDGVVDVFKKLVGSSLSTATRHVSPMMYHPHVLAWAILIREHVSLAIKVREGSTPISYAEDHWAAVCKGNIKASAPLSRVDFTCLLVDKSAIVSALFSRITLTSVHTAGSDEIALTIRSDRVVNVDGSMSQLLKNLMEVTLGKTKYSADGGNERRSLRTPYMWAETGIPIGCVVPRFPSFYYVPSWSDFNKSQPRGFVKYDSNPEWARKATRQDMVQYKKDKPTQATADKLSAQLQEVFDTMVTMGVARYEPIPGQWRHFAGDMRSRIATLVTPIRPDDNKTADEAITEEINKILGWATNPPVKGAVHEVLVPKLADTKRYVSRRMGVWRP